MSKKILLFPVFVFLTLTFAEASGFAQGACRSDREKFCAGVERGGGRIHACLREHESELSHECRNQLREVEKKKEDIREAHRACRGDKRKYCSDVKPGEGRIKACLQQHRHELSKDCKKALDF